MGVIVTLSFASALASRWDTFLRFWNAIDFGIADPQFGNDVGFYVFTLPMLHTIQGWLLAAVLSTSSAKPSRLISAADPHPPSSDSPDEYRVNGHEYSESYDTVWMCISAELYHQRRGGNPEPTE